MSSKLVLSEYLFKLLYKCEVHYSLQNENYLDYLPTHREALEILEEVNRGIKGLKDGDFISNTVYYHPVYRIGFTAMFQKFDSSVNIGILVYQTPKSIDYIFMEFAASALRSQGFEVGQGYFMDNKTKAIVGSIENLSLLDGNSRLESYINHYNKVLNRELDPYISHQNCCFCKAREFCDFSDLNGGETLLERTAFIFS